MNEIKSYLSAIGSKGGKATTAAKRAAARRNFKKALPKLRARWAKLRAAKAKAAKP